MPDTDDFNRGVVHGWLLAAEHLEEHGHETLDPAGARRFAADMRTRFSVIPLKLFIVTEGDYEDEGIVGVYDSLERAMGQYPVETEWDQLGESMWTASLYEPAKHSDISGKKRRYKHGVAIYGHELNKEI